MVVVTDCLSQIIAPENSRTVVLQCWRESYCYPGTAIISSCPGLISGFPCRRSAPCKLQQHEQQREHGAGGAAGEGEPPGRGHPRLPGAGAAAGYWARLGGGLVGAGSHPLRDGCRRPPFQCRNARGWEHPPSCSDPNKPVLCTLRMWRAMGRGLLLQPPDVGMAYWKACMD